VYKTEAPSGAFGTRRLALLVSVAIVAVVVLALPGQPPRVSTRGFAPPPPVKPAEDKLKIIRARADKLERTLSFLRQRQGVNDLVLAEAEVFLKAAEWTVRHNEFFQKESADWTLEALDTGLLRTSQAAMGEKPWLFQAGHSVVRGYRSPVDGSVQPYAVTFPADYGRDQSKKWRLDVVLHGRIPTLTEVAFIHAFNGRKDAPKGRDYVQLDIYGRGNNAYRWAGETDVYDAITHFLGVEKLLNRHELIDLTRIVLRGFSMGGAGAWHLGLHRPTKWCCIGPGAGFTTTHGYVKGLPDKLPAYQEACLTIYDAVDYAENAFNVPVVAYAGKDDPQLQAALNIQAKLKPLNIPMTLLEAPGVKHAFPDEWQAKAEAQYAKIASEERPEFRKRVRFVTYTLKYPACAWVEVLGLEKHYQKALVDAELLENGFKVKTTNVRALRLALPQGSLPQRTVGIDSDVLETRAHQTQAGELYLWLEKRDGHWHSVLPQKLLNDRLRRWQKQSGLQGPLDDAFTAPFLCVRGTGKPWHDATQRYADGNLKRFQAEWHRFMRGRLPIKDDADVSDDDIANRHLILFGDPGSNSLIAQVLDGLPLKWTRETITLGDKRVAADTHVPVLIYPSPLNSGRYVVLNSGHTFHAADFLGTNALLYPRLGDWAVLKLAGSEKEPLGVEVVQAGLFDDFWELQK
jgi:dienelactone hydrolase